MVEDFIAFLFLSNKSVFIVNASDINDAWSIIAKRYSCRVEIAKQKCKFIGCSNGLKEICEFKL